MTSDPPPGSVHADAARGGAESGRGVIFWDFDGTLATREGMWSGSLLETLDAHLPDHGLTLELIRPHMRDGFPWDRPHIPHPELNEPERWWEAVSGVYTRALRALDVAESQIERLARLARARYVDPTVGWYAFEDSHETLTRARAAGWSNHILSNHVPELPQIVEHLELSALIDRIHNSAVSGYEKPHRQAFRQALEAAGVDPGDAWMVGDNPAADIDGATAAGMRAILVRNRAGVPGAGSAPDLAAALDRIESACPESGSDG